MEINLNLEHCRFLPARKTIGLGPSEAGFIMRDIHLVAYKNAGFKVVAMASRTPRRARHAE